MQENFKIALKQVLIYEGGFVNHPNDPGGPTNKGITLRTYSAFLGRQASVEELKNITDYQVEQIYKTHYWNVNQCNLLPTPSDLLVFDASVNHGPSRATKFVQKVIGERETGRVTVDTVKRINAYMTKNGVGPFIDAVMDNRELFYRGLPSFKVFGNGWINRAKDLRALAKRLAGVK